MVTQDLWPQKYPKNSLTVKPAQRSWPAQLNLTAEEHSKARRCVKPGPWFTALQGIRDSCNLTLHKLFESISSSTRIVMTDNGPSTNKQTDNSRERKWLQEKTVLCHFCIFCGRRYPILFQPPFHDLMVGVSIFACLGFSLDGIVKGIREVLFASSNRGQMFWAPSEAVNITCLTSEFSLFLTISLPLAVGLQVK